MDIDPLPERSGTACCPSRPLEIVEWRGFGFGGGCAGPGGATIGVTFVDLDEVRGVSRRSGCPYIRLSLLRLAKVSSITRMAWRYK